MKTSRWGRRSLLPVVLLLTIAPLLRAQPLADRVPQDALIYIAWSGADSLGPGYEGSRLKGFIEASNVRQLIEESIPKLFENLGHQDEEAAHFFAVMTAIGKPMWKHPSALYFGGFDLGNADFPFPKLAILCQAGNDAKAVADEIGQLIKKSAPQIPFRVDEQDGLVTLAIGTPDVSAKKKPVAALATKREFQAALAQVGKNPVAVMYVDVEDGLQHIDDLFNAFHPPAREKLAQVKEAFGLGGLKRIIAAAGFEGKDWGTQIFVESPEPRTGVVKWLFDARPLSDESLKSIPRTATIAAAGHADFGALLAEIRAIVKKLDANASNEFENALQELKGVIGLDLQTDILDALGDEWAVYSDPKTGGSGLLGLTIVNRLKHAAKAEQSLTKLMDVANAAFKQIEARDKVTFKFNTTKQGDLTIHYLGVPGVAPSWAIKDGNLYIALYPQVIVGAAEHVAGKGKSILENEDFQAIRKRLGDTKASAIQFTDLPKTAAEGYQEVLMLSRAWLGMADLFGAKTPPLVLPTLKKLLPHLAPAGGICWVDDKGWHSRSISPFPGSEVLAAGGFGTLLAAPQAGIAGAIVPEIARARRQAAVQRGATQLRQIGQALMIHANDNKGAFPRTLGELILSQQIEADAFIAGDSGKAIPANLSREDLAGWVNQNSDIVYLGAGMKDPVGTEAVLAHEKQRDNVWGIHMLFGDGRVEMVDRTRAQELLKKQQEKKGQ